MRDVKEEESCDAGNVHPASPAFVLRGRPERLRDASFAAH